MAIEPLGNGIPTAPNGLVNHLAPNDDTTKEAANAKSEAWDTRKKTRSMALFR
jgi:hypothetical protein